MSAMNFRVDSRRSLAVLNSFIPCFFICLPFGCLSLNKGSWNLYQMYQSSRTDAVIVCQFLGCTLICEHLQPLGNSISGIKKCSGKCYSLTIIMVSLWGKKKPE